MSLLHRPKHVVRPAWGCEFITHTPGASAVTTAYHNSNARARPARSNR